ncbi:cation:proton antiporter regulatory subunit [Aquihabitans sp. McL0605]|uniref:cation:proton antiporter regulatory subunit n=1 Tax=Aquihabitans sp. McL0605 TaxID=3415671 RepID=UPI003CF243AC
MASTSSPLLPLPGIGHRLDLTDDDGDPVTVVRRRDGTVEIHHRPGAITVLAPTDARALGALASGHFSMPPELIERTADVQGGIAFDWATIPHGAWVVGLTIDQVAVRKRTGTTIVAVLRGSVPIVDPGPGQVLEAGDDLVIVGRPGERAAFERFLVEGS